MPPLPGIAHETITARTPPQVAARTVGGAGSSGSGGLRHRITSWMEDHLGRAAMPVAALAGGALLGTVGMLSLGPIGAAVGGAVGAFAGAALYLSD
ncbi:MAG: hypothetical protein JWM86_33 [Thermoleophilia bacterium]|nr:hypothetical protein [Thermoleophilia bacterium]